MAEASVRSGPSAIPAADTLQYTAPAGGGAYAIVRMVHIANTTAASIAVRVTTGAMGTATAFYYDVLVPANGALDWSGFWPLAASETIRVQAGVVGLTITLGIVTGP